MNREAWIHLVHEAREGNEALFNKAVTSNFNNYFNKVIGKMTKDDHVTKDIYISAMTKFWERFILLGETLPDCNIDGYIYTIAKNVYFEIKRKEKTTKHGFITSVDNIEILEKYNAIVYESKSIDASELNDSNDKIVQELHLAVQSLDIKCKKIVEQNILQNISLKKLKMELGISGTYNAIVQKKKRCLNHLRRILQREFIKKTQKLDEIAI